MVLNWPPTPEQWALINGIGSLVNVVCTVVIAAAAVVGFRALRISQSSLVVAQDNLELTTDSLGDEKRRRRLVAAIEQNDRFNRECIPLFREIWAAYARERESSMLGPDNSFKVSPTLSDHAKRLGASLESFALFALYDVADESLLREVAGREFCEQVDRLALLTGLLTSEARVDWRSAYKLAERWGPHIPDKKEEIKGEWEAAINKRLGA